MHGVFLMASPAHPHGRRKMRLQRLESASDGLMAAIFNVGETSLADVDLEYLAAAANGDLVAVQAAVQDFNANPNCADQLGRSALELALIGEHDAVVEYLLPRSNLQCLEDALLYSISKDNVRMCELLLDHPLYNNHRIKLSSLDGIYQRGTEGPRLRPNTTPIILAAQRNNFYIVQLLLTRGATIAPPHDYFCDCIECSNTRVFDSVKYSRSRLNTYSALASPAYMTLSSEDPILTAFKMSQELGRLADIEKEYKVRMCTENHELSWKQNCFHWSSFYASITSGDKVDIITTPDFQYSCVPDTYVCIAMDKKSYAWQSVG